MFAVSCLQLALLHMMGHSVKPLRHTAGTCIAAIVGMGGMWAKLAMTLASNLESGNIDAAEGALDTLYKVWQHQGSI